MPTFTPNYNFNKPLVNNATDADLWGGQLNSNWDSVDTLLFGGLVSNGDKGDINVSGGGATWTVDNLAVTSGKLATVVQNAILNEFFPCVIQSPVNGDYRLVLNTPYGFTISSITTRSVSGTCTATFKVNSTNLGGTANSVSSTEQTQSHATANVAAIGDDIVLTVSANSACVGMSFTINYARAFA